MKLIFLLVGFFVAGCATTSNEASLTKITPKQRVYLGRILVKMNEVTQPKCEIYVNYDIAPSIKLAPDGLVIYKTDREKIQLRGIACYHQASRSRAAWHHKDLDLEAVKRDGDTQQVKYIGDIQIDWKIDPKSTLDAAEADHESMGGVREGHVKDSGEMKITVVNNEADAEAAFYTLNPETKDKGFTFKTDLVQTKLDSK